jgi:hypothetical protein
MHHLHAFLLVHHPSSCQMNLMRSRYDPLEIKLLTSRNIRSKSWDPVTKSNDQECLNGAAELMYVCTFVKQ